MPVLLGYALFDYTLLGLSLGVIVAILFRTL